MNSKLIGLLLLLALTASLPTYADDRLLRLETRPGVTVPVFYMKRDGASATVILLPGGSGSIGKLVDGKLGSRNFLVRSRDFFADAGFNVAVMSSPSDKPDLDYGDRIADDHLQDVQKLVAFLTADSGLPIWLVGTSRGSVSATAAAIRFGAAELAGIVLTSSVVSYKKIGAVPSQNLAAIRIPVLVVHHEQDACAYCRPEEVPAILNGLKQAPFKKLVMLRGGGEPKGDPCQAMHYHGFIGMEREVVTRIADWIKRPGN